MPNYNASTIARIGDLVNGIRVDTSVIANATYLAGTQVEIFNVVGRVKIHSLFGEVCVVCSNNATALLFNYTSTTPSIAVQPLCGASGSMAQLAVAERVWWVGGAVATAAVLTATPGISDINATPQIVGSVTSAGANAVGTIGILTSVANQASGSIRFSIFYTPMSDGAYVTAVL
ncbi:MAG TPA: hypothetical protein DCZ95_04755 [Verrucomicrobia bacterium]|nr:hypothetical protein [Verrucomicrobiota bacterium]